MKTLLYWLEGCPPEELAVLLGYLVLCVGAYLVLGLAWGRGRPREQAPALLAGLAEALGLCAVAWDGLYFRAGEFRSSFPEGFLPLLLLPALLALALGLVKIPRTVSPALGVLWLGVAAAGAVMRARTADAWDAMVYNVFILLGALGAASALLLFLSLLAVRKGGPRAALWAAGAANALFYLFAALLFPVNRDWLAVVLALWLISALAALGCLLGRVIRGADK